MRGGPTQRAGDVHLRSAQLRRHLILGQLVPEQEIDDPTLLGNQSDEALPQSLVIGDGFESGIEAPRLQRMAGILDHGRIERPDRTGGLGGQCRLHLRDRKTEEVSEIVEVGLMSEVVPDVFTTGAHRSADVVVTSGESDGAVAIAEIAQDLASDGGLRIGVEAHAAFGIEAIDRVDQPDRAYLDDVLTHLAARSDIVDASLDQPQMGLDRLVAKAVPAR